MSSFAYAIQAISPTSTLSPHILAYSTERTADADTLLEIWNGATDTDLEYAIHTGGRAAAGDGTVSLPGQTFHADTDNGWYRIGADNWAGSAGGTQVIEFGDGTVSLPGLPTSDPSVADQLWNDGGTLKVSAG